MVRIPRSINSLSAKQRYFFFIFVFLWFITAFVFYWKDFKNGIGPKLQRVLQMKSYFVDNYVTDWWYVASLLFLFNQHILSAFLFVCNTGKSTCIWWVGLQLQSIAITTSWTTEVGNQQSVKPPGEWVRLFENALHSTYTLSDFVGCPIKR